MRTLRKQILLLTLIGLAVMATACAAATPVPALQPEPTATSVPPTATSEPPTPVPPTPVPLTPTSEPVEEAEAPSSLDDNENTAEDGAMAGDPEAGAYVFNAVVGCGCHFNRDTNALAGGNKFEGPFGVVYAPNITPDDKTGIGAWSDEEITDAIRFGQRPEDSVNVHGMEDGMNLSFMMPTYAGMSDKDVTDLVAFLRTLEPVANEIPPREFNFPIQAFEPAQAPPAEAPTDVIERGHYLANLARCGFCHTPNNEQGGKDMSMFLAGAPFRDTVAPNLTSDELTGLGAWSDEELVEFLTTGVYSDGSDVGAAMKGQINRGVSQLTQEDVEAIVAFLQSLPPIQNEPATPQ